jgi:hypothetical protein
VRTNRPLERVQAVTRWEALGSVHEAKRQAIAQAHERPVSLDTVVGMFAGEEAAQLLAKIWKAAGSPLCATGRGYPQCTAALTIAFAILLELPEPESPEACEDHGRRLIANSAACHVLVDGRRELDS